MHCPYCAQDIPVTKKGSLKPHMNGAQRCFAIQLAPSTLTPKKKVKGVTQRNQRRLR